MAACNNRRDDRDKISLDSVKPAVADHDCAAGLQAAHERRYYLQTRIASRAGSALAQTAGSVARTQKRLHALCKLGSCLMAEPQAGRQGSDWSSLRGRWHCASPGAATRVPHPRPVEPLCARAGSRHRWPSRATPSAPPRPSMTWLYVPPWSKTRIKALAHQWAASVGTARHEASPTARATMPALYLDADRT